MLNFLDSRRDEMTEMLSDWVKIPSISVIDPDSGRPFGENCAKMLGRALSDAERLGFKVRNFDNYVGTAELDGGNPALGVAVHLDVVPLGADKWEHNPWGGEVENGRIYGRGASDNKSACVSALYALLAYRKFFPEGRNIRVYFGCNEEYGMNDFTYYIDRFEKKSEMPPIIVPDAGNDVVYGQYGLITAAFHIEAVSEGAVSVRSIESGGINSVPGSGRAVVSGISAAEAAGDFSALDCEVTLEDSAEGLVISTIGKACHTCAPSVGMNAAVALIKVLLTLRTDGPLRRALETLDRLYADGALAARSGRLTFVMTGLSYRDGHLHVAHNTRAADAAESELVRRMFDETLKPAGFEIAITRLTSPYKLDPSCEFVKRLTKVKETFDGVPPRLTVTRAGNYAKLFETAVGYGHYSASMAHQKDEYIPIDYVLKAAKLMALTMVEFGVKK